jgi:uncharacterized membrane protein
LQLSESTAPSSASQVHLEETIQAIARLQAEHASSGTEHHRVVERLTSLLVRPAFLIVLTFVVIAWIAVNWLAFATGHHAWDSPPFPWLASLASLASLYLVVIILTTQRRDDLLARHRELLTLELAIQAEQKSAKAIALLEELRRDSPHVHDRVDRQADQMAWPVDPHMVIDAINEARTDATRPSHVEFGQ